MDKHEQIGPPSLEQFKPVGDVTDDFESSPSQVRTRKDLRVRNTLLINDKDVQFLHGHKLNRIGVTGANGTVYASQLDYLLGFTSLAFTPALVLPRPIQVGFGKVYVVKDEAGQAASTTITISSQGEELIDGAPTAVLNSNYASKNFYTDGVSWYIW